jgi:hypothetical protein
MAENPYAKIAIKDDNPYSSIAINGEPEPMASPLPKASMGAAETGIVPWFENAEQDLMHGGSRTVLGRALGHLQGNGDKGYSGLEAGVSPETAEFVGSPELGLVHALKGGAEVGTGHPLVGAKDIVQGGLQMATIPSAFVAPEAAGTGNEIATVLKIPNKAHAGRVFADVAEAAKNTPVTMERTQPELQRFEDLTMAGGRRSKPFTQLAKRINSEEPVNYPEARDFYSNIGDATSPTKLQKFMGRGMKPVMLRQGTITRHALNADIGDAAAAAGKGQEYADAMKEYSRAVKLQKVLRVGGLLGAGEAARRTGLLGNWIHRTALSQ